MNHVTTIVNYDIRWAVIYECDQYEHGNRQTSQRKVANSLEDAKRIMKEAMEKTSDIWSGPSRFDDFRIIKTITSFVDLSDEEKEMLNK